MKTISRYIMTLALLLKAVTGAWAGEEPQLLTTIYASSSFLTGSQTFDDIATVTFGGAGTIAFNNGWIQNESNEEATVTVTAVDGYTITSIKLYDVESYNATISTSPFTAYLNNWGTTYVTTGSGGAGDYAGDQVAMIEVYGYKSEPAITVEWNAATKTGNFTMPGSDVVLTPQYAPAAKWDVVENVEQLPSALEGIIAGQDAAIVTAGQSAQGTVMYAVTTSAEAAPELSAFSATVPTAKGYDDATTLYVWYYIQGQNTPDGQEATEENTFNDTEICTTPLTVTVLSNKFDIQFKAANANTIEAGKATVTVAGAAATVTDGKLQGVKMGSEVKLEAKPGYKFRKVEVKKGAAGPVADIVWDVTNVSDLHVEGDYLSYTKEGVKLSGNADQVQAEWNNSAYLGTPGMEFITMESGGFTFTAPTGKAFTKIEMKAQGSSGWGSANLGTGWAYNTGTVTWTGSAASTVKLLKDADMFSGDFISSIAFYLSE